MRFIRGVEFASSQRSHGIGLLYDGAEEGSLISITLSTDHVGYKLSLGLSAGRIEPFAGENLFSQTRKTDLIQRFVGGKGASFFNIGTGDPSPVDLREPQKLSLGRYLDFDPRVEEASNFDRLLHFVHWHHARSFNLFGLKMKGSESSHEQWLWDRGDNLWSVLRNLSLSKSMDNRFDTILDFMRKAFPSVEDILIETTGPTTVYGKLLEKGRRKPLNASGVSDGHLQMLLLLTTLFSEGQNRDSLILLDEPELSLHPWALATFADAVKLAVTKWNKQIFMATHSPVLLSQFSTDDILVAEVKAGQTSFTQLSKMDDVQDLLSEYAAGSLYMTQTLGGQSVQSEPASRG